MLDIITVFNRLTGVHLADCSLFEDIFGSHYDKFKFFYFIVLNISIEDIDKIICSQHNPDGSLIFTITPSSDGSNAEDLLDFLKSSYIDFDDDYYKKYYTFNIHKTGYAVVIRINCNDRFKNEDAIHEDRFSHLK
jgi:hypothetical protein